MNHEHNLIGKRWNELAERVKAVYSAVESYFEKQRGLSTSTTASCKSKPLQLDLQFFADPGEPDDKQTNPTDPPGGDDDIPTLADLFKIHPHLRTEHKQKISDAITKRFKGYDFDPEEAKAAIAEKKQRDENKGNEDAVAIATLNTAKAERDRAVEIAKTYAFEAYSAAEGLDAKLIKRLAGRDIEKLTFDDDYKLDKDQVEEIVADLKEEFPTIFVAKAEEVQTPEQIAAAAAAKQKKGIVNSGSRQQLNDPQAGGDVDAEELVKATLERLNKSNRLI